MQLSIFTDGGSRGNPGHSAVGGVVFEVSADGSSATELHTFANYLGIGTNNEAEYKAVLHSLEWLVAFESLSAVKAVEWRLDSQLVVNQLSKRWKIKEPRMAELAEACWKKIASLSVKCSFSYVPRAENKQADALVNQALDAHIAE